MARSEELLGLLPLAAARLRLADYATIAQTPLWEPLPGPQMSALENPAAELFFGGRPGGGKSFLLLGYALIGAQHSIILRREYRHFIGADGLIERSKNVIGDPRLFNHSQLVWHVDGRVIEFGACALEDDKYNYQGRAHDFYGFDEVTQFTESQYRFIIGWLRSTTAGQRCRVIATGNPPTTPEGEWVIRYWAPWLDDQYPYPAQPGELRWFAVVDGEDREVENEQPFEYKGETITPVSRSFIPASLKDNPYLGPEYEARVQNMPEPLRSQLLYGDFSIGLTADPWQCIPTEWVQAAQNRWTKDGRPRSQDGKLIRLSQLGVDVAQGGNDRTVLARRYQNWYAEPEVYPGAITESADKTADIIKRALIEGGVASIDADGLGETVYILCRALKCRVWPFVGSGPTDVVNAAGTVQFVNRRAAAWWAMREALDPQSRLNLALPPSRELRAELCAPRWFMSGQRIQLEKKEDTKKRLGRSPDLADAYVMASFVDPVLAAESAGPVSVTFARG